MRQAQICAPREMENGIMTKIITQKEIYLFIAQWLGLVMTKVKNIEKKLKFSPFNNQTHYF